MTNPSQGKSFTPEEWKRMKEEGKRKLKARNAELAKNLVKTASQALRHGKVNAEIRNERYETCRGCPAFLADSKRCSECGCFMEAKTWIGGNPDDLCPLKKWSR